MALDDVVMCTWLNVRWNGAWMLDLHTGLVQLMLVSTAQKMPHERC